MVEVEAEKAVASREAELRKEVEMMKASTRMEKLKGELLIKVSVEYEPKVRLVLLSFSFLNIIQNTYMHALVLHA